MLAKKLQKDNIGKGYMSNEYLKVISKNKDIETLIKKYKNLKKLNCNE